MHNQNVCVGIRHYTVISAILDRGKLSGNQNCLLPEYFAAGILTTVETTKQIIDFKNYLFAHGNNKDDAVLKVYDFLTLSTSSEQYFR